MASWCSTFHETFGWPRLITSRFFPLMKSSGSVVVDGKMLEATGDAMFVGAIQGMRPDSVSQSSQ